MKDIFLADAHLNDPGTTNYARLLDFFSELRGKTRTLFLLGDIFEFWIGYRHTIFAPYVPVLDALRRLRAAGTDIVYVEGNHDFHLGPYFEQVLGCRILPDGGEVILDQHKIFIAHGDLVDPSDAGYRFLRRILRSRPLRLFKDGVPPDLAWHIASWAASRSRRRHDSEPFLPKDLLIAHARQYFAQGCDTVITAHFHLPWMEQNAEGTIIALGDWIDQYSYGIFEDGAFRLATY